MKKIVSPAWAPDNIGEILKELRIACEIYRLRSMRGQFLFEQTTISTQLYSRVENGKRAITEEEIREIIKGLCYVDVTHMKAISADPSIIPVAMPKELKTIIQEELAVTKGKPWGEDKGNLMSDIRLFRALRRMCTADES